MMSSKLSRVRMSVLPSLHNLVFSRLSVTPQTLRFVQSLPKRERVPFSQKLRTTDKDGKSNLVAF